MFPPFLQRHGKAEELLRYVHQGNLRRVEGALADGADIDGAGSNLECPPLVMAADSGLVTMVKLLLRRGAGLDATAPRDVPCGSDHGFVRYRVVAGTTALHAAVNRRSLDVVRLLLQSGCDPNIVDSKGLAPLHRACDHFEGNIMIMATTLLKAGADPLLPGPNDQLAIHFAAARGHTDVLDMLLLKEPSTLNRPFSEGYTPLCVAAMTGRERVVLHLLQRGAEHQPAVRGTNILSPLAVAAALGHGEVLRILLYQGVDVVGSTESIASAIASAVRNGRAKCLDTLLGHFEGDVTRRRFARWSQDGVPLLHFAVSFGQLVTLDVLLAAGADETAVDGDGRRAREVIGSQGGVDLATEAAIFRILERGPAFRAASWRWRARKRFTLGGRPVRQLGVTIFRPKSKKTFVTLMGRFAR